MAKTLSWRRILIVPSLLLFFAGGADGQHQYRVREIFFGDFDPHSLTPLAVATLVSDAAVATLLEQGADPNERMHRGWTALHFAVRGPRPGPVIALLLDAGADATATNASSETPLHIAARWGDSTSVRLLAEAGADLNAASGDVDSPLMKAILNENTDAVSILLEVGFDPNGSDGGWSRPLPSSTRYWTGDAGARGAFAALLEAGADPNATDHWGRTALHYAVAIPGRLREDDGRWIDIAVSATADLVEAGADVNAQEEDGMTPIQSALKWSADPFPVVKTLVDAGAALSPLARAALLGDTTALSALIAAGTDLNEPTTGSWTPLHFALLSADPAPVITALKELGADSDALSDLWTHAVRWGGTAVTGLLEAGVIPADPDLWGTALRYGDGAAVEALLEAGVAVNEHRGNTLLHRVRSRAAAVALLDAGADPAARDIDSLTPLHLAADADLPGVIAALAEASADPNAPDRWGRTPLHIAAGNPETSGATRALLAAGADPNARTFGGWTPLHIAVMRPVIGLSRPFSSEETVAALLEAGADPNVMIGEEDQHAVPYWSSMIEPIPAIDWFMARRSDGRGDRSTPLHTAARYSFGRAIPLLLAAGADLNSGAGGDGTPLHRAAEEESLEALWALLDHGADPNATDSTGWTPLHAAGFTALGTAVVTPVLRHAGAEPPPPLHAAAMRSDSAAVAGLLADGADPDGRDTAGWTALHFAALHADQEIVDRLLGSGGTARVSGHGGWTPLHLAVLGDDRDMVEALLAAGADPDAVNRDGHTPLNLWRLGAPDVVALLRDGGATLTPVRLPRMNHPGLSSGPGNDIAYLWAYHELPDEPPVETSSCAAWPTPGLFVSATPGRVAACLEAGAPPNVRDDSGFTPLHHAARYNSDPAVVSILLEAGSELNAFASAKTPLHLAARYNRNPDVIEVLTDAGANPNAQWDRTRPAPLHYAVRFNEPAVIDALLDAGADALASVNGDRPWHYIRESEALRGTPTVRRAARSLGLIEGCEGWYEIWSDAFWHTANAQTVTACLEGGADPNRHDGSDEWSSLMYAATVNGDPEVFRVLLDSGAGDIASVLPVVARWGTNPAVLDFLLDAAGDAIALDEWGGEILRAAADNFSDSHAMVGLLLDRGVDPTAPSDRGQTGCDRLRRTYWTWGPEDATYRRLATLCDWSDDPP